MKRTLTYEATGRNAIDLDELRHILEDADKLNMPRRTEPEIAVRPDRTSTSRAAAGRGTIRRVTLRDDRW